MAKQITKYEIDDAGPDTHDCWPGRSAMNTNYDEVVVGMGDNLKEAFEDALDELVEQGYDVSSLENRDFKTYNPSLSKDQLKDGKWAYYVAIYVK